MKLMVTGALGAATRDQLIIMIKSREVTRRTSRTTAFHYDEPAPSALRAQVATLCDERHLDHCFDEIGMDLADVAILAMDMDSTLITVECIDELAARVGKLDEVSKITEATMRGEIKDFAASLVARVALLTGADESILEEVYRDDVRLTEGSEQLLATARSLRIKTILVSGGFSYFAEKLQRQLFLDYTLANRLEVTGNRLNGAVSLPIIDGAAKAQFISEVANRHQISKSQIMVIGDGANDIPMMTIAGISIAFHAKPIVKSQATHSISFNGLDILLDWMTISSQPDTVRH